MATTFVDQITGNGETLAYKAPCRVATTANVSLSGLLTVDGVVLAANDRVLVKDQTDARENGIYIVSTGPWQRARDFDSNRDLAKGTRVSITSGDANKLFVYQVDTSSAVDVGTTEIPFLKAIGTVSSFDVNSAGPLANSATTVPAESVVKAYVDTKFSSAAVGFATKALAEGYTPDTAPNFIQTAGYAAAGDGGGALYKNVVAEPSHEGKFSITLDDGTTVVWFEIAEDTIPVKALGAKGDTVDVAVTVSITSGTKALTAAGASFTADDVGKLISIPGAGAAGAFLGSTISAVTDSTHITLADNAGTTLSAISKTITYGTDDTAALTNALAVAAGRVAFFAPGIYSITTAVLAYSDTAIRGVYGASIIKPATKYTGAASYDGACIRISTFATASSLEEADILVEDMAFDYACRPSGSNTGQQVGVFLRYVERPKVLRCMQWSGGDLSGMLKCKDTQVSDCVAYDILNCAYDHWSSTGYVIVSNCITRSDSVAPHQCIQVTGDDTEPGGSTLLGTGHVEKIIIEGNIVDCPAGGATAGIIINCLDGGASANDVVIANNYVRGVNYGVALQGAVDGFVISGNMIRGVATQGIITTKSAQGTETKPTDGLIDGNLIADAGAIGIDIIYGNDIVIQNNKISSPATWAVRLQANSSSCVVDGNKLDAGASGTTQDLGTGNNIIELGKSGRYSGGQVYSAAAPGTFTDLDLSSKIGAYRCLVTLKVTNASGSIAKYVFRTNGDTTTESTLSTIHTGTNVCQMQNTESQYVVVVTDAAGVVEWASDVTTNTTNVNVLSYQRLQ